MEWAKLVPELSVVDIQKSLYFYIEILGFKAKYERKEEFFAYIDLEGAQFMLDQISRANPSWQTAELNQPFGRGINFQIEISDIDKLYQRILKRKLSPFAEIKENWYRADDKLTGNREFLIQDPDGYLLRFFTDLGAKSTEAV
ncbi:MAG: VOC family protein [Rhizobiales bacterium]|nr:VOC family protein [Hyphomicrobiales bacterium]